MGNFPLIYKTKLNNYQLNITTQLTFVLLCLSQLCIAQFSKNDSLAIDRLAKAEAMAESNNVEKAKTYFLEAHDLSPYNAQIQDKGMEFFLKQKDYENLEKFLSLYNMKNENHNGKARKLYYHGILHMKGGVEEFHKAFNKFHEAKYEIERAEFPDLDLWADILVAAGYAKVVTRSHHSDGTDYEFSTMRIEDFMLAYTYYKLALTLEPEHSVAVKNLDTIENRILRCGRELPDVAQLTYDIEDLQQRIHQDSIKKDSLNYIDRLRSINVNHLPKRIEQMISLINQYDEVVLVMDISGSMEDHVDWGSGISRFEVMQALSLAIIQRAKKTTNIGGITVGRYCTDPPVLRSGIGENRRVELASVMETIYPFGATPLNRMLIDAGTLFTSANNRKTILLISDGMDSCKEGINLCNTAVKLHSSGIDMSVFSFLMEGSSYENDFAYQIYECMTEAANGIIFTLDEYGNVIQRKKKEKNIQEIDFTLPQFIDSNRYGVIECLVEFDWAPIRTSESFMKE